MCCSLEKGIFSLGALVITAQMSSQPDPTIIRVLIWNCPRQGVCFIGWRLQGATKRFNSVSDNFMYFGGGSLNSYGWPKTSDRRTIYTGGETKLIKTNAWMMKLVYIRVLRTRGHYDRVGSSPTSGT